MNGKLHIYCGDGKGKTTAAMGLALRAAGSGKTVWIAQLLKDGTSAELAALAGVPGVQIIPQTRRFGFIWTLTAEEKAEARDYYSGLLEAAFSRAEGEGLLVVDEALGAVNTGMVDLDRLLTLLDSRPAGLEVALTGRNPAQPLLDRADYVTEMKKVKHPFDQGLPARRGIEY